MKKRALSIIIALMMIIAALPVVSFAAMDNPLPVGVDLSKMNTTDLNGKEYTAEIFSKYQLTVLNIWATWCGPCTMEMPHFEKLYKEYEPMGVNMVGVLLEDSSSTVAGGRNLIENNGYTYLNLRMDNSLKILYNNTYDWANENASIPVSYLVDNNGKVISGKKAAFNSYDELVAWVLEYYQEPELESITMQETLELGTDRMYELVPTYNPGYADISEPTWTSSDEKVATVNEKGWVTGLQEGTAVITLSVMSRDKKYEAKCTVTVKESEPLADGVEYYRQTTELKNGGTYMVVVKYGDEYFMMSNAFTQSKQKCRPEGTKASGENIMLCKNDSGETEVQFQNVDNSCLWLFMGNNEDGFEISNIGSGQYLGVQRTSGIYRLSVVAKPEVKWIVENGLLKNITSGKYSGQRQYLTFFEDVDADYEAAFDIIELNSEHVIEVMYYERVVVGANVPDDGENVPGDMNGNGHLDAGDATLLLRCIVGLTELTEEEMLSADLNENGRLDSGDVGLLLREAL